MLWRHSGLPSPPSSLSSGANKTNTSRITPSSRGSRYVHYIDSAQGSIASMCAESANVSTDRATSKSRVHIMAVLHLMVGSWKRRPGLSQLHRKDVVLHRTTTNRRRESRRAAQKYRMMYSSNGWIHQGVLALLLAMCGKRRGAGPCRSRMRRGTFASGTLALRVCATTFSDLALQNLSSLIRAPIFVLKAKILK